MINCQIHFLRGFDFRSTAQGTAIRMLLIVDFRKSGKIRPFVNTNRRSTIVSYVCANTANNMSDSNLSTSASEVLDSRQSE